MFFLNRLSVFLVFFSVLSSCKTNNKTEVIEAIIQSISSELVSDKRTAIFDYNLTVNNNAIEISGETSIAGVVNAINDSISKRGLACKNKIILLPEKTLNDQVFGVVNVSVANLRSMPSHAAEMVTQSILGTWIKVYKKKDGWYLVQTPDLYIGWLNGGSFVLMNEAEKDIYVNAEKIIFTDISGMAYNNKKENSNPVSDLVVGSLLLLKSDMDNNYLVSYPDGREAYLDKKSAMVFSNWLKEIHADSASLVAMAKRLYGLPYLWGGTSSKGVDCSGFTKTVYFMNGIVLPRDASQQSEMGILIDNKKDFSRLKPGDLLFFGMKGDEIEKEKVVHVGMWIGNMNYMHSSGDVHISSMDAESDLFDEYNYDRYLETKRIIGQISDFYKLDTNIDF